MLDSNDNLIYLDIRNNPGMILSSLDVSKHGDKVKLVSKCIYDKLLKNIKKFKVKRDKMKKK